ncbi:MAG: hypothetical protein GY795_43225 [Desulfobacterales bacterium]|nr:hypothetical protein [Desulfobacterales bacterium]
MVDKKTEIQQQESPAGKSFLTTPLSDRGVPGFSIWVQSFYDDNKSLNINT